MTRRLWDPYVGAPYPLPTAASATTRRGRTGG